MGGSKAILRLSFLGPPRIELNGTAVRLRSRKVLALLVYLAVAMQRHSRDALAALLYPRLDRERARAGVRQSLSVLRSTLGGRFVQAEGDSVWLEPHEDLWVDVQQVGMLEPTPSIEALERVEALFRDDFLAGFFLKDAAGFDAWQTSLAERMREEHSLILGRLSDLCLAGAGRERALEYERRRLALDPADERAHRALMRAYALSGKRAEALRQYEKCRDRLRTELDAVPDAETEKLRDLIARGQPLPPEPVPRPEGDSRQSSRNLPPPQNAFIGRKRELNEVVRAIVHDGARLLTITGTAGTGKTRLAIEASRQLADRFPDGVLFVDLAPLREAAHVIASIGSALGVQDRPGASAPLFDLVRDHLGARTVLLVLDNFEHILEAAGSVAALLDECPNLAVLATSREALRLRSESEFLLEPFPVPSEGAALKSLLANDAVRLFADRAKASRRAFALGRDTVGIVARICKRLEGLPLSIELAASRARFLSPDALLSLLESRGSGLLSGGPKDVPERHRSLWQAVSWSHELLGPFEKALLRRLSVFRGGFTLEAAAAVCAFDEGEDVLRDLESLVDKNLVRRSRRDEESWYELFVAIREFAEKRLEESGEAPRVQLQHAGYYLQLVEKAAPVLDLAEGPRWARRLELEYSNIRAAVEWSTESSLGIALQTAGSLERFLDREGHWQEGLSWVRRALSRAAGQTGLERERATALAALCNLTLFPTPLRSEGMAAGQQSVELWRRVGDKAGLGHALLALALSRSCVATTAEEIIPLVAESVRVRHEAGDLVGSSASMFYEAYFTFAKGDLPRAREIARRNSELARKCGDLVRLAALPGLLGLIAFAEGDYPGAQALIEEGLKLARGNPDAAYLYYLACSRGGIALLQGDYRQAHLAFKEAFSPSAMSEGLMKTFENVCLGFLFLRERRPSEALALLRDAVQTLLSGDYAWVRRPLMCCCLAAVAGVRLVDGHAAEAARVLGSVESVMRAPEYLLAWATAPSLIPRVMQLEYERLVEEARSALGKDAAAEFAVGRALSLEASAELALSGPATARRRA